MSNASASAHEGPARPPNGTAPRMLHFFREMLRIRYFEEAAIEGMKERLVLGAIHPSIGQEAVAVGICANLDRADIVLSTHRGHGHTLAKGAALKPMMRELFGKEGGYCKGKGGSMHIADFSVGMLGANGVVAANIVITTGAAHAIRLRRSAEVVVCFFGDGAINRGPFLEGLNWAQVNRLPILFVCEDNGFAATTRTAALSAGEGPGARARSLGIATAEIDGNDVGEVDETAARLIAEVRAGEGPRFLHVRTYRLTGHTASDPAAYRLQSEVDDRRAMEPIERLRARLLQQPGITSAMLDEAAGGIRAAVAEAYADARDAAYPAAATAFEDVQDLGDPRQGAY
jgi:acetoin:2,6-dichlorophenolindophenol oxidoreductase subunit alpha